MQLEKDDFEYVFEPVLKKSKELLQLSLPENLIELSLKHEKDMIEKFGNEATKIFQIVPALIGKRDLIEIYKDSKSIDDNDENVTEFIDRIDLFTEEDLLLRIRTQETRLKMSPDSKLLITPLGILFLHCYYSMESLKVDLKFEDVLIRANELLGTASNSFAVDRISYYLDQASSPFNKKEIVLTIFLLLSQATSSARAIVLEKPPNGNLLEPLTYIAKSIFQEEPELFSKVSLVGTIRRSTGASGLQGKTSMLFVKSEPEDKTGYWLYFDLARSDKRVSIQIIIDKLLKSIKIFEERDDKPYRKRTIRLVDAHVGNRNLIFKSKPYIREKLLSQFNINTMYLERLHRMIEHHD